MKDKHAAAPAQFLPDSFPPDRGPVPKQETAASVLLCSGVFGLALFGCLFLFLNVFDLPVVLFPCAAAAVVCWALWTAMFALLKGRRKLWLTVPVLLMILLAVLLRQPLQQGLLRYYNRLADMLNMTTYWTFPRAPLQLSDQSAAVVQNTLAVRFLFFWVSLFAGYAAVGRRSTGLLFAVTAVFLWAPVGFRLPVLLPAFFAVLISYFTLYSFRLGTRRQPGFRPGRKRRRGEGRFRASRMQTFAVMPAAAAAAVLAVLILPQQGYRRPQSMSQLRSYVENFEWSKVDWNSVFGIRFQGFGDGDLRDLGTLNLSDRVVLKVRTEPGHTVYLHDFVGAKLENRKWEAITEPEYQSASAAFPDLIPQRLGAMLYEFEDDYPTYWDGSSFWDVPEAYQIRMLNTGLPEGTAFLSSFLCEADEQTLAFSADAMAYTRGGDEFSFSVYPLSGSGMVSSYLSMWGQFEDYRDYYLNVSRVYPDVLCVPEDAQNRQGVSFSDFYAQLEAYHQYLYDTYTELPEDTRQAAQRLLEEYRLQRRNIDIERAICDVRDLLQKTCRYSLSPGQIPPDADFTTYFLEKSREGYCVHFATASAVLLRAMGIPVRYAEGFVLTRFDSAERTDPDDYIWIRENRAHAWIEVYDPVRLEWIPVEMTPGFSDMSGTVNPNAAPAVSSSAPRPSSAPSSSREEESSSSRPPVESRLPLSSAQTSSSAAVPQNPSENGSSFDLRGWIPFFAVLAAAVLAVLLLCSIRRARALLRQKKLFQQDTDQAVLYGCRFLIAMLRAAGCPVPKNDDTPESYTKKALAVISWLPRRHLRAVLESGQKARFAEKPCSAEEQQAAADLVSELLTMLPNQMPRLRAAWFRMRFPR
ncbi:MAG: transglutaminase family protein [Firmicutes bacterium]|nr:transglutaminase family protein [Bacillota bacterium]